MTNYSKITNFSKDQDVEKKINTFLDANYYNYLSSHTDIFYRATLSSDQFAGIDVRMNDSYIDEKSKNTNCPNQIANYFASIELFHTQRDGAYTEGWFCNPKQKTTHYFFEYRFEDNNHDISSVIIVSFSKNKMKEYLDRKVGYQRIVQDAKSHQHKEKGYDDITYKDEFGHKVVKLTKSYEGATVLTFNLTDLEYIPNSMIVHCVRGNKPQKKDFNWLRKQFS